MKGNDNGNPTISSLKTNSMILVTPRSMLSYVSRVVILSALSYERQPGFPHHVHVVEYTFLNRKTARRCYSLRTPLPREGVPK